MTFRCMAFTVSYLLMWVCVYDVDEQCEGDDDDDDGPDVF